MDTTYLVNANVYYFKIIGPIDVYAVEGATVYATEQAMFEDIHDLVSLDVEDMDDSSILIEYDAHWDKWTETNQMGCWEPQEIFFKDSIEDFINNYTV